MTTISSQADELCWPDHLVDASDVRAWISSVLPGHPAVTGPTKVLHVKEWGVIARFALSTSEAHPSPAFVTNTSLVSTTQTEHGEEVVFKASYISLFAHTPFVYELLGRCCAGSVPRLLAWDAEPGRMWTLFRPFEGVRVREINRLEPLLKVARTMVRIQVAVAAAPASEKTQIARLPVSRIPALFDEILQDIRDTHLHVWNADDGAIAQKFNLPADPLRRLLHFRGHVRAWAAELEKGDWPETIDHTDLYAGNATLQAGGRVLIYDWEEATIGSPFFTLEQLLVNARVLDQEAAPVREQRLNSLGETPSQRAVRHAYLEALPWKTYAERERALELAGYLWPIKDAFICKAFTLALGRDDAFSELTAIVMARALRRWESMELTTGLVMPAVRGGDHE